jgi:hypothetical protein
MPSMLARGARKALVKDGRSKSGAENFTRGNFQLRPSCPHLRWVRIVVGCPFCGNERRGLECVL